MCMYIYIYIYIYGPCPRARRGSWLCSDASGGAGCEARSSGGGDKIINKIGTPDPNWSPR